MWIEAKSDEKKIRCAWCAQFSRTNTSFTAWKEANSVKKTVLNAQEISVAHKSAKDLYNSAGKGPVERC